MLTRLADRLILCPSTDPIEVDGKRQGTIETPTGKVEAWISLSISNQAEQGSRDNSVQADQIAIKFPGTAGRAERSGPHPFELHANRLTEIWTINHAGYGGSSGEATLQNFASTCDAVWNHVQMKHPDKPIWLVGNSLGCISALYLAARQQPAGLFLRNPVPVHQMIATRPRYNWWNFGFARHIANSLPTELDALENARRSSCRAYFVRSERDTIVPGRYQQMVFDVYGGDKHEFALEGAEHHHPVPDHQIEPYVVSVLGFLRQTARSS